MSASFDHAFEVLMRHEGGWSDHANDKGGATKYGVTKPVLARYRARQVEDEDIAALDLETAKDIWRALWWDRYGYGELGAQIVCTKVFDCAVVQGPFYAARHLQMACMAAGSSPIAVDGMIGPITKRVANQFAAKPATLIAAFRGLMWTRFRTIIEDDPTQAVFDLGWQRRALH